MADLDPFLWPWCPRAVPAVWRAERAAETLHGDDVFLGAALEAYAEHDELFAVADDVGELDFEGARRGITQWLGWWIPFVFVLMKANAGQVDRGGSRRSFDVRRVARAGAR